MDLNICASCDVPDRRQPVTRLLTRTVPIRSKRRHSSMRRDVRLPQSSERLLQQFRADEEHELAAAERHLAPVVDRKVEDGEARGRQIVVERLLRRRRRRCRRASAPVHACRDCGRPASAAAGSATDGHADDLQELRRIGAVEFRQEFDLRLRRRRSFIASQAISQVCCARTAVETSTGSGKGGCRPIQPPISAASVRPRSSRRRSWSWPDGASFRSWRDAAASNGAWAQSRFGLSLD